MPRRGHPIAPETRAKLSQAMRRYRADPEIWERTMLAANTPAAKARTSQRSQANWANPAYAAKTRAAIREHTERRQVAEDAAIERAFQAALVRQRVRRHT
jgi:hypothetical protein